MSNGKEERIECKAKTGDIGGDVIFGAPKGIIGEYLIDVGFGTTAQMEYLLLDTGSDITWVQ